MDPITGTENSIYVDENFAVLISMLQNFSKSGDYYPHLNLVLFQIDIPLFGFNGFFNEKYMSRNYTVKIFSLRTPTDIVNEHIFTFESTVHSQFIISYVTGTTKECMFCLSIGSSSKIC